KSDIDFVIATAKNRVWIVRTLCTLLKKTILFNRKKFFCYNHIVSEDRLEVVDRNLYTAMEVVTLVPMINPALYKKFLNANTWTRAFLPNLCLSEPAEPSVERGISPAERFINAVVPSNTLDSVDRWLMMKWRRAWIRRYPGLSPAKRGQLFQSTPDVSTAYAGDFFQSIMGQYELRLRACDLVPPVEFSDNRIKSPTPSLSIL
ncbi:MAG TPA: hypothetical protein VI758_05360, partial [Bacteroidota bacterium]